MAVLFTTDPTPQVSGSDRKAFECGLIPDVYATIDFPAGYNLTEQFSMMRQVSPRGPLVNSEFYTGWYTGWGQNVSHENFSKSEVIIKSTEESLNLKANINFFMFADGTNFGFKNGAKVEAYYDKMHEKYCPLLTSFNWGGPIDETGNYTQTYYDIRNFTSKYYNKTLPDFPKPLPKGEYGKVRLVSASSIFNTDVIGDKVVDFARVPKTFEQLNVMYGYVLYETKVPNNMVERAELLVKEVRDRAIIFLDQVLVGNLSRRAENNKISLTGASGKKLSILIENQGRVSDGEHFNENFKGLLSTPTLNGQILLDWNMTGLPFENISWVHNILTPTREIKPPALYVGELVLPPNEQTKDTFVDLTGWGKGVIFINDFNIGRYWPSEGPQVTLYLPECYLRENPQKNTIVVFETDYVPENKEIVFRDHAIFVNITAKYYV